MQAQVTRLGDSFAIRLPKQIVDAAKIVDGALVDITVVDNSIRLSPARPQYSLEALVEQMTPDNQHDLVDDGPMGVELL